MATKQTVQELINLIVPAGEYSADEMRALLTDLLSLLPDGFYSGSSLASSEGAPSVPPPIELSGSAYHIDTLNRLLYKWESGVWSMIVPLGGSAGTIRQVFIPEAGQTEFELSGILTGFKPIVHLNGVIQRQGVDFNIGGSELPVLTWLDADGVTLDEYDNLTIFY